MFAFCFVLPSKKRAVYFLSQRATKARPESSTFSQPLGNVLQPPGSKSHGLVVECTNIFFPPSRERRRTRDIRSTWKSEMETRVERAKEFRSSRARERESSEERRTQQSINHKQAKLILYRPPHPPAQDEGESYTAFPSRLQLQRPRQPHRATQPEPLSSLRAQSTCRFRTTPKESLRR